MSIDLAADFQARLHAYTATAEHNDRVFADFTALTWDDPLLARHRRHAENHKLGFGAPAFHALWARLLATAIKQFGRFDTLEIGVFKGQVISLWSLLARHHGWLIRVDAINPLAGQPMPPSGLWRSLLFLLSASFREQVQSGDFDATEDCETIVREHYASKIVPDGWLVMDDAAFDQPGSTFWKGHETVSRACLLLAPLGFKIVFNVGHNRVFQRQS